MGKLCRIVFFICCLIWLANAIWPFSKEKRLSPVIFVPGDGGSQLEAKLNKASAPYPICSKQADWYSLWLNLELVILPMAYCWVDNVKLYYDKITRTTHNTPGVEIRVTNFGDSEVVEWIDPTHAKQGAYFTAIAERLLIIGYERRKNLFGAPYDFRKAPNELQQWFRDLKALVIQSYEMNGNTPVTFITHSMGSSMTLVFLQQQSSEWKEKYVQRQISLAGAFAGSMKAVKVFAMGDDLDAFLLDSQILKQEQITNPSTAWLLPSPLFWKTNEVLVETPTRVYTMAQLDQYFRDINYMTGWEMRKDTLQYTLNFSPPDVELHCLYGDGIPTVERLRYKSDNLADSTPKLITGNGDGTVNQRSLRACQYWMGYQGSNITTVALSGVDHMQILSNKDVLNYIETVLQL